MIDSRRPRLHRSVVSLVALLVLFAAPTTVRAQGADSSCTYARCGLSIVPRLTGLEVVRGESETRIGSLAFLWPHDVGGVFNRDSVSRSLAQRATGRRRIAAVMTDAGVALVAAGAIGMLRGNSRVRGAPATTALSGFALIGMSVPVHFSADADLSRAVWRYNAAFAGTYSDRSGKSP